MGHANGSTNRFHAALKLLVGLAPWGNTRRAGKRLGKSGRSLAGSVMQLLRGFIQIAALGMLFIGGPFAWILRDGRRLAHTSGWEAFSRMWYCFSWGTVTTALLGMMFLIMRFSSPEVNPHQGAEFHKSSPQMMSDSSPAHVVDWMD